MALASAPMGIVLMSAGLGLEACADWQKSEFKKRNPSRFCDVGLYSVVRDVYKRQGLAWSSDFRIRLCIWSVYRRLPTGQA